MKKNFRVLQINGFRGLFLALFAICCVIAGFIAFPSLLTMHAWNYIASTTGSFPVINLGEGTLLWAIIIFSSYVFNKKKFFISFNGQQELSDEEVKEVIAKIKAQKNSLQLMHPKDISIQKLNTADESSENTEASDIPVLQSENKDN